MADFFARPLFQVDQETFSWRDVVLISHLEGRWDRILTDLARGVALARAQEDDEDEELEEAVEEAAAEFRYERELLTAEEIESWLAARGVTPAEWLESIRRSLLRARSAPEDDPVQSSGGVTRGELEAAVRIDLACTALGPRLAERAAQLMAAGVAAGGEVGERVALPPPKPLPAGLEESHLRSRQPLLERLVRASERFRQGCLVEEALQREIRLHQMDWVRLGCVTVEFDDLDQAREAALCLREDQLSMEAVAASAHLEAVDARFYVDDLDPVLQPLFLSAIPGDVIGPAPVGTRHALFQVTSKTMPGVSDPEVRARAADRLVTKYLATEAQRRVQWLVSW